MRTPVHRSFGLTNSFETVGHIKRKTAFSEQIQFSPLIIVNHLCIEATIASEPADGTKEIEKALVIPEKASSFRIHPDKICQDQCFYCGGRFGLFDTPCHVAQIKSLERQKKILDSTFNAEPKSFPFRS